MRNLFWSLATCAVLLTLASTVRLPVHAQDFEKPGAPAPVPSTTGASIPVQDAMLKVFDFPFSEPTQLDEVGRYLHRTLGAPVVLDLAALKRQKIQPTDLVQLELRGVRLKTGLQLLLDQVKLTYRVVAEDNLLILTDNEGADDPVKRVQAELRELHLEVHTVQEALDEVLAAMGLDSGGAKLHQPTIIEETPAAGNPNELDPPVTSPRVRKGL